MLTNNLPAKFETYYETCSKLPDNFLQYSFEASDFQNTTNQKMLLAKENIYVQVEGGTTLLYISKSTISNTFQCYSTYGIFRIKKGSYFNFVNINELTTIKLFVSNENAIDKIETINENITHNHIDPKFHINHILTFYDQDNHDGQFTHNIQHSYWELILINNGQLAIQINNDEYQLNTNDVMLFSPNQLHTISCNDTNSTSFLTIIFEMTWKSPTLLTNHVYHSGKNSMNTLFNHLYETDGKDIYFNDLCLCYLKQAIIVFSKQSNLPSIQQNTNPLRQRFEEKLLHEILNFIHNNYYLPLTIEQICHKFSISRTYLQQLFIKNLDIAPKQYIIQTKLTEAKVLIKEGKYTISEIAVKLGFNSIHYFSRRFKQEFNISPSEYERKAK